MGKVLTEHYKPQKPVKAPLSQINIIYTSFPSQNKYTPCSSINSKPQTLHPVSITHLNPSIPPKTSPSLLPLSKGKQLSVTHTKTISFWSLAVNHFTHPILLAYTTLPLQGKHFSTQLYVFLRNCPLFA